MKEPLPSFTTKPKKETRIEEEAVARIAEDNNPQRWQAAKTPSPQRRKRASTGLVATSSPMPRRPETIERFYNSRMKTMFR